MAKKRLSDQDRFRRSYVEVVANGCWEWQLFKDEDGYGYMKLGSRTDGTRRQERAHRFAYECFVAAIPAGLQIDHLCRNRSCVNPEHMEPVTQLVNTQRGWRATKLYCPSGHPLFGPNLRIASANGQRVCKECQRHAVRENYVKTHGAAQKRYGERNKEKRRQAQAQRRASWSEERLALERERGRIHDAMRRRRRKSV